MYNFISTPVDNLHRISVDLQNAFFENYAFFICVIFFLTKSICLCTRYYIIMIKL